MRGLVTLVIAASLGFLSCRSNDKIQQERPLLQVEPRALDLGSVPAGRETSATFTISNVGRVEAALDDVVINGDARGAYALGQWPRTVAPGESATISVTYRSPSGEDVDVASVVVRSNADAELSVALLARSLPCMPRSCAERGVECGSWPDECGQTVECGSCGSNETCSTAGVCECTPTTCAAEEKTCGEIPDGCGSTLNCGSCASPQSCGGGGTPNVCGTGVCTPTTCLAKGKNCGEISDGCGSTLRCGTCDLPDTCGGAGVANVCGFEVCQWMAPALDCTSAPAPTTAMSSTCTQPFPPTQTIDCPISSPGTQYYVTPAGSDSNAGTSPTQAWATLCKAVQSAVAGSTIRVAQGVYGTRVLRIEKPLTFKGGYDSAFGNWNPDAFQSTFTGQLVLAHQDAVFGGFRIRTDAPWPAINDSYYAQHFICAGALVRNYVEIVNNASGNYLYGIIPSTVPGQKSQLRCNDIYIRAPNTMNSYAIEYGNFGLHRGIGVAEANRICLDAARGHAIGGYGTCGSTLSASVVITNNLIESTGNGSGVSFYSCDKAPIDVILTNNTIRARTGVSGYSGTAGMPVRWRLTNNVLFSAPSASGYPAVAVGSSPNVILSAEGNLIFGYSSNDFSPAPQVSSANDTSGTWSASQVFVSPGSGSFLPLAGGPAVGTGINVHGQPVHGTVTTDLLQQPRPTTGAWDRGAYKK